MIDDATMEEIITYALGWCPEYPGKVEWADLYDRIESVFDVDLGCDLLGADIVRIKKGIQDARKQQ